MMTYFCKNYKRDDAFLSRHEEYRYVSVYRSVWSFGEFHYYKSSEAFTDTWQMQFLEGLIVKRSERYKSSTHKCHFASG